MAWMLLAACTAEMAGEEAAGGMDLAEFLDEEVLAGIPERAWLKAEDRAAIGWGPGAMSVERFEERPAMGGGSLPVFAIEEGALGLVDEWGDVRMLVAVPRSSLQTVLVEETLAVPDPGRFDPADPRAPGLLLPAGMQMDLDESEGEFIPINMREGYLRATGWAPVEGVDHFARAAQEDDHGSVTDLWLEVGAELLDEPGGRPFAWVDEGHSVKRLQPAKDGFVLVESAHGRARARGYVPTPADERLTIWGSGSCGWATVSCGLTLRFGEESSLPAGTRLHLSPGGPVVGEVLRDLDAPVMDREDGWEAVEIETRWGPVDLWVAP